MAGVRLSVLNDIKKEKTKQALIGINKEERKKIKQIKTSKEYTALIKKKKEMKVMEVAVKKLEKKIGLRTDSWNWDNVSKMSYNGKIDCQSDYATKIEKQIEAQFLTLKISIATVSNEEVGALIKTFIKVN